jgi:hypothetical protein
VWPAYLNNDYYYFDDKSLKNREWQYTSNWGMVPVNIVLNTKPDAKEHYGETAYEDYYAVEGCHCYGSSPYDKLNFSGTCEPCDENEYSVDCNFVMAERKIETPKTPLSEYSTDELLDEIRKRMLL